MRKYVHWLKINGMGCITSKDMAEQFNEIDQYLSKYPESKATMFQYDSGSFNWIIKLVCNQCYGDLDMCVNSGSTHLERLHSKPKNIGREKDFVFPECYKKYL